MPVEGKHIVCVAATGKLQCAKLADCCVLQNSPKVSWPQSLPMFFFFDDAPVAHTAATSKSWCPVCECTGSTHAVAWTVALMRVSSPIVMHSGLWDSSAFDRPRRPVQIMNNFSGRLLEIWISTIMSFGTSCWKPRMAASWLCYQAGSQRVRSIA